MDFQNESKDILNAFLMQDKKRALNIPIIVLCMVFVASIVCTIALGGIPDPEPSLMTLETQAGDYCFIDVADIELAATSDYDEGYYYILDTDEYLGIIMTSPADLTGELLDVYNDNEAGKGVHTVVTGIAVEFPEELIQFAIEDFALIDENEFYEYFGYYALDTSQSYFSPGFDISITVAIFSFTILLVMGIIAVTKKLQNKFAVKKLERSGDIDLIAREMRMEMYNTVIENGSSRIMITSNYLISNNGFIIKLSDIIWCYKQLQRVNGIAVNAGLTIGCKNKKLYFVLPAFSNKSSDEKILEAVQILSEKVPDLIIGFSRDNRKEFKRRVKEAKNSI